MKVHVDAETAIVRSPRVIQVEGIFDVPPSERSARHWDGEIAIEDMDWNIGLIVGPSGSGKSTIARQLFGQALCDGFEWPEDRSILDAFPAGMGIQDITDLLVSVGFSTIPSWVRPFRFLSTGEQFRVTLARLLAEQPDLAVIDEFTSVVDRQVAQVGSAAVAKMVRRKGAKLICVTCHYDVLEWLQPDWVYEPHVAKFTRRSVQPRPGIELDICRVPRSAWDVFRHHHYLTGQLPPGEYFGGFVGGQCVAFASVSGFPHPKVKDIRRARRQVVLPDWQGLGIARKMEDWLAARYTAMGYRFRSVSTHPGMVRSYMRSPDWVLVAQQHKIFDNKTRITGGGPNADPGLKRHQTEARMMLFKTFEYRPKRKPGGA